MRRSFLNSWEGAWPAIACLGQLLGSLRRWEKMGKSGRSGRVYRMADTGDDEVGGDPILCGSEKRIPAIENVRRNVDGLG